MVGKIYLGIFGENALSKVNGSTMALTIIDDKTSYEQFVPVNDKSWKKIKLALLEEWIRHFDYPESFHSNQGIISEKGEEWCESMGIEYDHSGAYAHQQNG